MARNTVVFILNRAKRFKKVCWKLFVVVTQIGRRFGNTPECYGISLQCAERDNVQPEFETDSDQSQFTRSRASTQPAPAQVNGWDSQNSSRNFITTFQFVSRRIQTRQDTFHIALHQADSNTTKYDAWQHNSGYETNVYPYVEWTRRTTPQISSRNILMDSEHSRLRRSLGFESWMVNMSTNGLTRMTEEW